MAAAQAELGIIDMSIPGLEPLPGLMPALQGAKAEEVDMFPALRGADFGAAKPAAGDGKYSAVLGEYTPLPVAKEANEATPPEAPGQAPRWAQLGVEFVFCVC